MTGVSWFEARAYCQWLTQQLKSEFTSAGLSQHEVRLPLEDQWERAARAANATKADARRWPWGDDETAAPHMANVEGAGCESVSAVATFAANPIGLHDMAGNVWQWQDNLYAQKGKVTDFRVGKSAALKATGKLSDADRRALRGGSWYITADLARCAYRDRSLPDFAYNYDSVGVRVVLSLVDSES